MVPVQKYMIWSSKKERKGKKTSKKERTRFSLSLSLSASFSLSPSLFPPCNHVCVILLRLLGRLFRLELLRQRVKHSPKRREDLQIRLLHQLFHDASARVADARQLPFRCLFYREIHSHGNARVSRDSLRVRSSRASGVDERLVLFVHAYGHL